MSSSIIQFGTSRFLQAHADLILSEARATGQNVGTVTIVETTGSPASRARVEAFAKGQAVPIRIRGIESGQTIDEERFVDGIAGGLSARNDLDELRARFIEAKYVLSNTGDKGFEVPENARPDLEGWSGYPELLTALLRERFLVGAGPITVLPCELISSNGSALRARITELARIKETPGFGEWLDSCIFVNALVDRIVSAPINPVGAVAEPYALWAIEAVDGFVPPADHQQIVLVKDLAAIERKKLFILNLGHTFLAQKWLSDGSRADLTVREAIDNDLTRDWLEGIMTSEVIPVFPQSDRAQAYWAGTLERFANPFLDHRLSDIATNHDAKVARRARAFIDWARTRDPGLAFPQLEASFAGAVSTGSKAAHAH